MKRHPAVIPAKAGIYTWYQCVASSDGSPIARLPKCTIASHLERCPALVEDDAGGFFVILRFNRTFAESFIEKINLNIKKEG